MAPEEDAGDGLLPVEEVVPPRSVLTELARGFLLARETDGRRAEKFASTFLKEYEGRRELPAPPSPTFARLFLNRLPHGAVERPSRSPAP